MAYSVNRRHEDNMGIVDKMALTITKAVGTMMCAFIFACIAMVGFPGFHDFRSLILWVSSEFLQLVLLSVIMVGNNLEGKRAELLAEQMFEAVVRIERMDEKIEALLEKHHKSKK